MIKEEIKEAIRQAVEELQKEKLLPAFATPEITIEWPRQKDHGDYSSSIALKIAGLCKKTKRTPQGVAETLLPRLNEKLRGRVEEIKLVLPGFINFSLAEEYLCQEIKEILAIGPSYGQLNVGRGRKIQVEFISANPTGPLTLGNARGGFLGDTLASVLQAAGWRVEREFYINDTGEQILKLGHSILGDQEAVYQGEYINELRAGIGKSKDAKVIGVNGAKVILERLIQPVVEKKMKIKFDRWFWESELHTAGKIREVVEILKRKKMTYEKDGALWFKTTQFGDDKDRVFIKKDGQPTYALVDAAYHLDKFKERGFEKVIDVWGADHAGDVARIKAAVEVLGFGERLEIILYQFVRLISQGQEVKMSKRAGTYVTVEELIDQVGLDAARFFMLTHSADSHLDFDLELAKEQSQKNPVFYVQYAYARICSLLAKYKTGGTRVSVKAVKGKAKKPVAVENSMADEWELALIKQLIKLPEVVEETAKDYQVQRLPQYALELVRAFHKFYEECRVISEDKAQTQSRLDLVKATQIVLRSILDLMGIDAPERMERETE